MFPLVNVNFPQRYEIVEYNPTEHINKTNVPACKRKLHPSFLGSASGQGMSNQRRRDQQNFKTNYDPPPAKMRVVTFHLRILFLKSQISISKQNIIIKLMTTQIQNLIRCYIYTIDSVKSKFDKQLYVTSFSSISFYRISECL